MICRCVRIKNIRPFCIRAIHSQLFGIGNITFSIISVLKLHVVGITICVCMCVCASCVCVFVAKLQKPATPHTNKQNLHFYPSRNIWPFFSFQKLMFVLHSDIRWLIYDIFSPWRKGKQRLLARFLVFLVGRWMAWTPWEEPRVLYLDEILPHDASGVWLVSYWYLQWNALNRKPHIKRGRILSVFCFMCLYLHAETVWRQNICVAGVK